MKRILTLLLLSATILMPAMAQDKIAADRATITKTASDFGVYKALADRFAAGHKLQPQDVAAIYYGSALQPGFDAAIQYPDIARTYAAGDYATALSLIWKALTKDPANPYLLFTGYGCARSLENKEAASLLQGRVMQVCDMIFKTGTGVTQDSPFIILRPTDVDEFIIKYIQPQSILGRAKIDGLEAVRVNIEGVPNDVIFYFRQF